MLALPRVAVIPSLLIVFRVSWEWYSTQLDPSQDLICIVCRILT
jgi:hypothetical protein